MKNRLKKFRDGVINVAPIVIPIAIGAGLYVWAVRKNVKSLEAANQAVKEMIAAGATVVETNEIWFIYKPR